METRRSMRPGLLWCGAPIIQVLAEQGKSYTVLDVLGFKLRIFDYPHHHRGAFV